MKTQTTPARVHPVKTLDGNEAVASVAYRLNEIIAIYPITPSSGMGEWADAWASGKKPNIWNRIPSVIEMQSEAGAAGAIHGALQGGCLSTTFTASQGLLLMIPNMYKIAGELTPTVFHVAARSIASQALSIFGDHSDVMATRETGFGLLSSASVQEAMDFAAIAQAVTLESRIPFLHFMDGFRTSHELNKIEFLEDDVLRGMIDEKWIVAHRGRALTPDRPVLRGTAQNSDVFFQARESVNPFYLACPKIMRDAMDRFATLTGRKYNLFEYHGHPQATRVLVLMGSGCEVAHETMDALVDRGEKVGLIKVRLYRPFSARDFIQCLPASVQAIAVLDRTKEPGSLGEPLFLDCATAVLQAFSAGQTPFSRLPIIVGGRYGLASKDFTPAMVKAVLDPLSQPQPKTGFTVGIHDDVTHTSLLVDPEFSVESPEVIRALFYGLGSDGTVGANKNSIKIIGEETPLHAQGYFEYDSKKAGAITISHLRFGPQKIRSSYLVRQAHFVGCHNPVFLELYPVLESLENGGVFLLNAPYPATEIWKFLPKGFWQQIREKKARFYIIDATKVARKLGMGGRINVIMQVCFFALSDVLPRAEALAAIKKSIQETYGKKGAEIVKMNLQAVDQTLENLFEVSIPNEAPEEVELTSNPSIDSGVSSFFRDVLHPIIQRKGDELPVSLFPVDGTYPTGTARFEKRNLATEIPVWDENVCIQCGKCVMVCPHAVIRVKAYDVKNLEHAPTAFKSTACRDPHWQDLSLTIQVAPEDCTGCGLCVDICPARNKSETRFKAINMMPQSPILDQERKNWDFFLALPEMDRRDINVQQIRQQQVQEPLFEFSGACAGCGETPYIKLMTQLFGDRAIVANATGCSSIYGGNLPTTPWTKNREGRGPAWSNSLFEDNAEFGLGIRLAVNHLRDAASLLLKGLSSQIGDILVDGILSANQRDEAGIYEQRERVRILKEKLATLEDKDAPRLLDLADYLVKKSIWIVGGDGWGYDIGYGGLDHVLASGYDVNVLLLDTEVYSNTGGQTSKATPLGAVAKFSEAGKRSPKKDLGLIAMTYGNIYVASVAMGAKDTHTLKAFLEAEAYEGPSLIIAYSHCIAHGIDMSKAMQNQKAAVDSGHWLLYRFHPEKKEVFSLELDSKEPSIPLERYRFMENRFKMLSKSHPETMKTLTQEAKEGIKRRWQFYQGLSQLQVAKPEEPTIKKEGDEHG